MCGAIYLFGVKMDFLKCLEENIVLLDGAMGTMLQKRGLALGELPEEWNLTRPREVEDIHRAYIAAGADVIYANTFGANSLKLGARTEEVVAAGVKIARRAAGADKFVALDVGPTGKQLKRLGDLDFVEAVGIFSRTVSAGVAAGADLIAIETMNDSYELKAALVAAKECGGGLPVIATCVFDGGCKTMAGASPEAIVAIAEGLGVCAVGINCSLGPAQMLPAVKRMLACASVPVIVKPNAGLPEERGGETFYDLDAPAFAEQCAGLLGCGVRVLGGCCGTTPEYISLLRRTVSGRRPAEVT